MRVQASTKDKSACDLPCHAEASPARIGKKDKKEKTAHHRQALFLFSFKNRLLLLFNMVRQIVQAVILQRELKSHK